MSPTSSPRPPGARHAAGKAVHRDSHGIHKQQAATSSPPSSSSTNNFSSVPSNNSRPVVPRQKLQPQPVIIYTHTPRVIRTSPNDFMSIVQKLTGLDSSGARNNNAASGQMDESSSSSSSESYAAHAHSAVAPPLPYVADTRLMPPPAPPLLDAYHFVAPPPDIPLFAPGPSELPLCVPTELCYDQLFDDVAAPLDPFMMSANMNGGGAVFSPKQMVEAMRTFPDAGWIGSGP